MILKADLSGYKQAAANSVTVAFAGDLETAGTNVNAACPPVETPSAARSVSVGQLGSAVDDLVVFGHDPGGRDAGGEGQDAAGGSLHDAERPAPDRFLGHPVFADEPGSRMLAGGGSPLCQDQVRHQG
jgi:hypothetical protein